jgi:hypothetical protein
VFAPEAVLQSVKDICNPAVPRAGSYGAEPA